MTAVVFLLALPALDILFQGFNHNPLSKILAGYDSIKNSASDTYRFEAANIDLKAFFGDKKYPDAQRFALIKGSSSLDLRLTEGEGRCPQNPEGCSKLNDKATPKTASSVIDFEGLQNIPQTADLARNLQQQLDDLQKNTPAQEDNVIRSADLIPGNSSVTLSNSPVTLSGAKGLDSSPAKPDQNDRVRFLSSQNNRDLQIHYQVVDSGIKQTLALTQNSLPTYQFLLNLTDLQVIKVADNSYILLNADRNIMIQVGKPIVTDGFGQPAICHSGERSDSRIQPGEDSGQARMTDDSCGQINIFQEPRGIIMEIGVDQQWFSDKSRQYPITIETSFIVTQDNSLTGKIDNSLDQTSKAKIGTLKILDGRHKSYQYETINSNFFAGFGNRSKNGTTGSSKLSFAKNNCTPRSVILGSEATPGSSLADSGQSQNDSCTPSGIEMIMLGEHPDVTIRKNTRLEAETDMLDDLKVLSGNKNVTLSGAKGLDSSPAKPDQNDKRDLIDTIQVLKAKRNLNVEYKVYSQGVKENLILTAPPGGSSPQGRTTNSSSSNNSSSTEASASGEVSSDPYTAGSTIEYALNVTGATPVKGQDGVWRFYKPSVILGTSGARTPGSSPIAADSGVVNTPQNDNRAEVLFSFAAPYAYDNAGIKTNKVTLDIQPWDKCSKYLGNNVDSTTPQQLIPSCYKISVATDKNWLLDPNRSYPVTIDPTVVDNSQSAFNNGTNNRTAVDATPEVQSSYKYLSADNATVGLWHLDETSGPSVADSTSYSNTGTATGTTVTTTAQQVGAAARTFNGSSDFINVPDSNSLNATNSSVTLEAWVKPTSTSTLGGIVSKFDATNNARQYQLYQNLGNFSAIVANSSGSSTCAITSSLSLVTGNWYHLALTYNGYQGQLYINGNLDSTCTAAVTLSAVATAVNIGRTSVGDGQYFAGTIDEVRISNVARSGEEIKSDANRFSYGLFTSQVLDLSSSVSSINSLAWSQNGVTTGAGETLFSTTSLVAQWNLNEGVGATASVAAGSCGNSCLGSLINFTNTSAQDAIPASGWTTNNARWGATATTPGALMLDGTDDYVAIGASAPLSFTNSTFTVETWIKTSKTNSQQAILSKDLAGSEEYYLEINTNGTAYFSLANADGSGYSTATSTTVVNDGTWHYLVGTADGTNVKIYIDGRLENTTAITTTSTLAYTAVDIGRDGQGVFYFQGILDSTRIYSRALGQNEIISNYNSANVQLATRTGTTATPDNSWEAWKPTSNETAIDSLDGPYLYNTTDTGLVSYWPLDENGTNGSTVNDRKGVNNGTALGVTTVDGKFGRARSGNGVSNYISVGSLTGGTALQTVEFWVYPTSTTTSFLELNNSAYISASGGTVSATGFTSPIIYVNGVVSSTIVANQWQQITVTTGSGLNASGFNIGRAAANTGAPFLSGIIDEVRVYSSALSAATVQAHAEEGSSRGGLSNNIQSTDTSLKIEGSGSQKLVSGAAKLDNSTAGLWHLDETSGTGAYVKDARGGSFSTDTNGQLTAGLMGYWNMNEGVGTTAYDNFNGNHAGSNASAYTTGQVGQAKTFNGSSDYAVTPSSSNLALTNAGSISVWFKGTGTNKNIARQNGTANTNDSGMEIIINSSGNLQANVYLGTWVNLVSTSAVNDGAWHQATLVVNGTAASLYLDGNTTPVATGTGSANLNTGNGTMYFAEHPTGVNFFSGQIDEVGLWNKALTTSEVSDLNNSTNGQTYSGGGGTDGIPVNSPSVVNGFYGKAYSFNGTSQYINVGSTNPVALSFERTNSFSVEAWLKKSATGTDSILSKQLSTGNKTGWNFSTLSTGEIQLDLTNTVTTNELTVKTTSAYANDLIWHHLAVTYDGSSTPAGVKLYVDGNSVATTTVTNNLSASILSAANVNLGARDNGADSFFHGTLDEIKVSNIVRTGNEITEDFRNSPDQRLNKTLTSTDLSAQLKLPFYVASDRAGTFLQATIGESEYANLVPDVNTVGFWHLDETQGSGAYLKDASGFGSHGTPTGTSSIIGKFGNGRQFTGSASYVDAGNGSNLQVTGALSLEAWIKTASATNQAIVTKDATGQRSYGLTIGSSGRPTFYICVTANCSTTASVTAPVTVNLEDGNWHSVTGVFNPGATISLYIDGVLSAQGSTAQTTINNGTAALRIGNQQTGSLGFTGGLDEVRVSNIARSADDIRQAFDINARTHTINIDFRANLSVSDLITNSADTAFTIDATSYGGANSIGNLFPSDKIIVKEKVGGTEYIAFGNVQTINTSTGAVTVSAWDAGSTFPSSGFTQNATVFKWQREYFDITGSLATQRNAVTLLTLRTIDGSTGSDVWLDDLKSAGNYLNTPAGSSVSSTLNRYLQYRGLFSSADPGVTANITSATVDYSIGPTTDQEMRHGTWFNAGSKQSMWWAR